MPGYLSHSTQAQFAEIIRTLTDESPLYRPVMPRTGTPFSVRMTNCGSLGWVSDQAGGYRYEAHHPETGRPWPAIPDDVMDVWSAVSAYPHPPEACLVNWYEGGAKMGLHVDADEEATDAPVVSISLGDSALFRIGGQRRGDPTHSFRLSSGDVLVLAGAARHAYHGIDRVYPGTSRLLAGGGRVNLTLRRVRAPFSLAAP